jgi:predicted tellurium resistance membrane protein TerC
MTTVDWIGDPQAWIALGTLTALEVVLGIDNIIFIALLAGRLPEHQQGKARKVGLLLAMLMRIALLLSLTWVMGLTAPLFTVLGQEMSGRDLVLILGGLFLLAKATREIHHEVEGKHASDGEPRRPSFGSVLTQIVLLDIVFSLDSVITAVGMVEQLPVMIAAVVIAIGVMLVFARTIAEFVQRHPTVKMLALSFLVLIGVTLMADGLGQHIPKGYIYFAMAFSVLVELLNQRVSRHARAARARRTPTGAAEAPPAPAARTA